MRAKSAAVIFLMTLVCATTFACAAFSPIVGKWQDPQTKDTIEFTSGGDVIIKSGTMLMTGKYELVGSDVVKVKFEGFAGALASLFGGASWEYEISGNTLTLTMAGRKIVLKRTSS